MRSFVVLRILCLASASCTLDPGTVNDGGTDSSIDAATKDVVTDAPTPHPFTVGIQTDAPWPLLGGTSGRTGRSKATGPTTSHVRWKYDLGAPILHASPVIDNTGTIYVGATSGRFVALNPSGAVKWQVDVGAPIETTPVIARDGTIYLGTNDASVLALSPAGKTLRKAVGTGSIRGGLTIDGDGTVYFTQAAMGGGQWWTDGSLHFSIASGTAAIAAGRLCDGFCWTSSPADLSRVFLRPNLVVSILEDTGDGFGFDVSNVVAFHSGGSERWVSAPDSGAFWYQTSLSASANGAVTANSPENTLHFTPAGVLDWTYIATISAPLFHLTAPIVDAADVSYFGASDGQLIALDAGGKLVWSLSTNAAATSAFAMGADGALYIGLTDGFVWAIGP